MDFIAFISLRELSPSTARSYISGISYHCQINGFQDPTVNFVISKMLNGYQKLYKRVDARLPITHELLKRIVVILQIICYSTYEAYLFSATFCLAYFGFFRVGELVVSKIGNVGHALNIEDISIDTDKMRVFLRWSKTDQNCNGVELCIPRTGGDTCPIYRMLSCLKLRKGVQSKLPFCHANGLPVTWYQFASILKKSMCASSYQQSNYRTHSFRIGATTAASKYGLKDEEIKSFGRWKSAAFKSYITFPSECLSQY